MQLVSTFFLDVREVNSGLLTQQRKSDAKHKDHDPSKHGYEEVASQHDHHDKGCGILFLHAAKDVFIVGCPHKPREHEHHHNSSKDHVEGAQEPGIWGTKSGGGARSIVVVAGRGK